MKIDEAIKILESNDITVLISDIKGFDYYICGPEDDPTGTHLTEKQLIELAKEIE